MGLRSGLFAGCLSSFTPNSSNHVFLDLTLPLIIHNGSLFESVCSVFVEIKGYLCILCVYVFMSVCVGACMCVSHVCALSWWGGHTAIRPELQS